MKNYLGVCLFLTYALLMSGCAATSDTAGTKDEQKGGLFLVNDKMVCQEALTSKMWQLRKEGPFYSLKEAKRYIVDLELGGYGDWRLPTRSELFNLFYMHYWKNDGNCVMNHKGDFWGVSKDQSPFLGHWEDYLLCGPEYKFTESLKTRGYVRAIRP